MVNPACVHVNIMSTGRNVLISTPDILDKPFSELVCAGGEAQTSILITLRAQLVSYLKKDVPATYGKY